RPPLLGEPRWQEGLFRSARSAAPHGRQRVPLRNLPGTGELGAHRLSAPRFLSGARQGHALRGLGAAPTTSRRPARDLPVRPEQRANLTLSGALDYPHARRVQMKFRDALLALSALAASSNGTAAPFAGKPTIVLVHGAFADALGWQRLIPILLRDGYNVTAVEI